MKNGGLGETRRLEKGGCGEGGERERREGGKEGGREGGSGKERGREGAGRIGVGKEGGREGGNRNKEVRKSWGKMRCDLRSTPQTNHHISSACLSTASCRLTVTHLGLLNSLPGFLLLEHPPQSSDPP